MIAEIMKIVPTPSKFGGQFWYVFFKGEDGKSFRSCVAKYDDKGRPMRNFKKWEGIINRSDAVGLIIDGLRLKGDYIDADSNPVVLGDPPPVEQEPEIKEKPVPASEEVARGEIEKMKGILAGLTY